MKMLTLAMTIAAACLLSAGCDETRKAAAMPDQRKDPNELQQGLTEGRYRQATFAAGCFWGVEETFRTTPGVVDTRVGYTGGHAENPTYKQVCAGGTGHAEAVHMVFDPDKVSYEQLLKVFWESHNPTTPNRQGPDVGSQYRSAVFYHTPEQRAAAEADKKRLTESNRFGRPVVTEISPAGVFWPAEEYHQRYLLKRGAPQCH